MKKLKWKYSKKDKEWYINESVAWANDGMRICKIEYQKHPLGYKYKLHFDHTAFNPSFKKLSSAKTVAELIKNG